MPDYIGPWFGVWILFWLQWGDKIQFIIYKALFSFSAEDGDGGVGQQEWRKWRQGDRLGSYYSIA